MKFWMFFGVFLLLPQMAGAADDIGFSYTSSDGTVYTSTKAPAYCKAYYDPNSPTRNRTGDIPYACIDPQFTTSRGVAPRRESAKKENTKKERSWWQWGRDEDSKVAERDEEIKKIGRPPARIPARSRVEKEHVVELTPVIDAEDDWKNDGKKEGRLEGKIPPAPTKRRESVRQVIVPPSGDFDDSGKGDGKKSARIIGKVPPAPTGDDWEEQFGSNRSGAKEARINGKIPPAPGENDDFGKKQGTPVAVVPPPPTGDDWEDQSDNDSGKKYARVVVKIPPAPTKRRGSVRQVIVPPSGDFDDSGKGDGKKSARIIGKVPPAPTGDDWEEQFGSNRSGAKEARINGKIPPAPGENDDFGKKQGTPVAVVPPAPKRRTVVPVPVVPEDEVVDAKKQQRAVVRIPPAPSRTRISDRDRDVDIEALRARLQPIEVIPPSGKVGTTIREPKVILAKPEVDCVDPLAVPKEIIPSAPWFKDVNNKVAEQGRAPASADAELLAKMRKRTKDQEQCLAEAPKSPTRVLLAFDASGDFDYVNYYKQKKVALPAKDEEAYRQGVGKSVPAEYRESKNIHWKYYGMETGNKDVLSPAVRCAFELATKPYKNKDGKTVYNTIALGGHSFGSAAAYKVANVLRKLGVRVDLMVTTDPRQPLNSADRSNLQRPPTVDRWVNFYQRNDPLIKGFNVDGAINTDVSDSGATHALVPQNAEVSQRIGKEIMQLPRCKSDLNLALAAQKPACD